MSKRYGRNQKRAHRNRIAALENQIAELQKDYDGMYRLARDLREEIDTAKRIVGEYCVAFEPSIRSMHYKATDWAVIQQFDRDYNINVSSYWDWSKNGLADQNIRIEQIRLPIMCVLASQEIRNARHFAVAYDGKVYGYAIDPMAFRVMRYPKDLARRVTEQLVDHIYDEFQKAMPRREPPRTHTRDEPEPRVHQPNFQFNPLPDFLR